jgi:ABC-type sugar transport system ATPase subunit
MERLRSQGASVIFVTHKLDEVFRVADRITVLRDGCKIDTVIAAQSSTDKIVSLMVGRSLEGMFARQAPTIGPVVLEVRNFTREGAFYEVSLALHAGEILGLAGLMGAGRTDLARAIFGVERADAGELRIGEARIRATTPEQMIKAGLGLAPEDRKRDGLVLGMSVGDNLTLAALRQLARWGLRRRSAERAAAAAQFTDLSVQAPSLATEVLTLSGGNQQKVVIGKWLATAPRILILDEPTRGIDVGAKAEVHALMQRLAKQGVAILMISSELIEIMSVCDRILVMRQGRVAGEFVYGEATQEQIMACATGQTANIPIGSAGEL